MKSLKEIIPATLKICDQHLKRLRWSIAQIKPMLPFTADTLKILSDEKIAVVDQFITRYSKLQDLMGSQLFPALLELSEEPGQYESFIDKLNRLEKINAIPSAKDWRELRSLRNSFSHDYPEDSKNQAEILNKALESTEKLVNTLKAATSFANHLLQKKHQKKKLEH